MAGGWGACMAGGWACMAGGMHGREACMAGGHAWWGHAWQGLCMAGGAYMAGGHAWWGHAWQGVCMAGTGMHGRGVCVACMHAPPPPRRYYEIRSMSGRYASYWNALLFSVLVFADFYFIFKQLFVDKDTIINAVTSSHDIHLLKIDNREDDIVTRINQWMTTMIEDIHQKEEIERNRERVSEINNLIDHLRDEMDNLDLVGPNY